MRCQSVTVNQAPSLGVVLYREVRIDFLLHLLHVRDDPDDAVLLAERFQGIEDDIERLFIQRPESLIQEKEVLP